MDLDLARIEEHLARLGSAIGKPLSLATETASTNDDAKRAASGGAPHGATFVADAQTAGRGRGGHTWHSPPGENLYMSIILRPHVAAHEIAPITLAVGLAVARVIARELAAESPGAPRVGLKWPNDVFVDGRKIAGVLVEGQLRGDRVSALIAGIGVNVRTRTFPPDLTSRATSLALAGAEDIDRSALTAALIAEVGCVVEAYEAARLAPLLREIRDLDLLRGSPVEIGEVHGVAEGIDDAGRLLVRDEGDRVHPVASGEARVG